MKINLKEFFHCFNQWIHFRKAMNIINVDLDKTIISSFMKIEYIPCETSFEQTK